MIMSHSPGKHSKSSSSSSSHQHHHHHNHHHHHHHHHNHREQNSSMKVPSSHASSTLTKPLPNLSTHIKIQDNSKILPHYSVALSKPHDDCLPMDELDFIQMELETLLSSVSLRYRALKVEFDYLEDRKHQKKNAEKDKPSSPSTSAKRKRDDKKSSSKDSSRHGNSNSSANNPSKHSKIKLCSSSHSPSHSQRTDASNIDGNTSTIGPTLPNQKLHLPKNNVPNKFWLSVEPYCMPITHEDIKLLDHLIDDYTEPLVAAIPELGTHFAIRLASDDLRHEQDGSAATAKATTNAVDVHGKVIDEGITGPLTQRLVAALLEEDNDMQSDLSGGACNENATIIQDSSDSCTENNASTANQRAQTNAMTSLLKSGIDVEKRLKRELFDLGIFDAHDMAKEKDDEVLNEIKRVRTELLAIAEYNRSELKLLRTAAKEEMKRLEVKRKLDIVDHEIIEAYKRVVIAKQKRRPLTKQERIEILRLSDEQKRLSDQLEAMPIPGFNSAIGSTTSKLSNA